MKNIILTIFLLLSSRLCFSQNFLWAKNGNFAPSAYLAQTKKSVYVSADEYCVKYDCNGNLQWSKPLPNVGIRAIAADTADNLYITGTFFGTITIDNLSATSNPQYNDLYLLKLDKNGTAKWLRQSHVKPASPTNYAIGEALAIDKFGDPIFVGRFCDSIVIGNSAFAGNQTNQIFIAKYDKNGNYVWAYNPKSDSYDGGTMKTILKTDKWGNCYLSGNFFEYATFDNITINAHLQNGMDEDMFLAKFDNSGTFLWAKSIGGKGEEHGLNVMDTDSSGNTYLSGYFESTPAHFGNLTLNAGPSYYFTCKYDSSGNCEWVKYGSPGIITAVNDGFYSNSPGFVTKYDALDNAIWTKNVAGYVFNNAMAATTNALYITGGDSGTVNFDTCHSTCSGIKMFIAKLCTPSNNTAVIQSSQAEISFSAYPNPAFHSVTVSYASASTASVEISVLNALGQKVHNEVVKEGGSFVRVIELSGMVRGAYFIELIQGNLRSRKKVILN